jgi:hypothetical protein
MPQPSLIPDAERKLVSDFIRCAELFAAVTGTSISAIGANALRDRAFLSAIRDRKRSLNLRQYERVRSYMAAEIERMIPSLEEEMRHVSREIETGVAALQAQMEKSVAELKERLASRETELSGKLAALRSLAEAIGPTSDA